MKTKNKVLIIGGSVALITFATVLVVKQYKKKKLEEANSTSGGKTQYNGSIVPVANPTTSTVASPNTTTSTVTGSVVPVTNPTASTVVIASPTFSPFLKQSEYFRNRVDYTALVHIAKSKMLG